jgi:hypothetical protein
MVKAADVRTSQSPSNAAAKSAWSYVVTAAAHLHGAFA